MHSPPKDNENSYSMTNNKTRTVSNKEISISILEVEELLRFFVSFSFERSSICTKMAVLLDEYGFLHEWKDEDESAARNLISQCVTRGYVSKRYFGNSSPDQLGKIIADIVSQISTKATNLKETTILLKKIAKEEDTKSRQQKDNNEKRLREITRDQELLMRNIVIKRDEVYRINLSIGRLDKEIWDIRIRAIQISSPITQCNYP